jgi:prepilin-type processing-associated H-X9-DG protein
MGRWDVDHPFAGTLSYTDGWPIAGYASTMYNHVAPPNWSHIDCAAGGGLACADTPGEHAIISARSSHPGVVNVCYGDGHGTTITDNIDLTVWRSLGTRNGGEVINATY